MSDIFENTVNKYRHSASAVMLFIASFIMFVIGANHFVEDTWSSYLGLQAIEIAFDLKVQVFDWTYWTMSIAPQVASIVFFFIFLSNTKRYEYLGMAIGAQGVDFFSDAWYRSNGNLLVSPEAAWASAAITFFFFTVGSEIFLTIGFGLMLKMAAPALTTWKKAAGEVLRAKAGLAPSKQEKPGRQVTPFESPFPKSGHKPKHKPQWVNPPEVYSPNENYNSEPAYSDLAEEYARPMYHTVTGQVEKQDKQDRFNFGE